MVYSEKLSPYFCALCFQFSSPNQVTTFSSCYYILLEFLHAKSSKGECIFPIQVYSFLPKVGIHIHLLSTFFFI